MSGTTPSDGPDAAGTPDAAGAPDAADSADPMDATDPTDPDAHGGPSLSRLAQKAHDDMEGPAR